MIHEARIVHLDGAPHANPSMRFWSGDTRGRWVGRTLVIDTTNFKNELTLRLKVAPVVPAGNLHLVEKLTLLDADTLRHEATFDDPTTWTRPWTAVTTWHRSAQQMFEYACHEGNYSLADILAGARAEERR